MSTERTGLTTSHLAPVESWIAYSLPGGVSAGQHLSEVSNASQTLLLNIHALEWDPVLLRFFGIRESVLPRLVSTSEVYGYLAYGPLRPLKDVPLGGLVSDQCSKGGYCECGIIVGGQEKRER